MIAELKEDSILALRGEHPMGVHPDPVVEIVRQRLDSSLYVALRTVACSFDDGLLTLTGLVPSFYLKQVALALTEQIDGIKRVDNLVKVIAENSRR